MTPSHALLAYCRAGFEPEVAADLRRIAAEAQVAVDVEAITGSGFALGTLTGAQGAGAASTRIAHALTSSSSIFARAVFAARGPFPIAVSGTAAASGNGARQDRVTPLLAAIAASTSAPWRSVWMEFPDTNEGKALSTLARALGPRLDAALRARGDIVDGAAQRLRIFLPDGATAWIGESIAHVRDWPMGIPRLRMPGAAPSRSTLKLAEAFTTFLGERETTLLRPGLHAVDLGAAPGGWTWQLVQRGVRVTAVDNGPLKGAVAQDALVTHVRDDAFRYRPRRPVDWLVCDVVESPIRIAELVARWIADGLARRAIFNLKLPMKKRYDEVRRCEARMLQIVEGAGLRASLELRQLYHDREEVTGYLVRE